MPIRPNSPEEDIILASLMRRLFTNYSRRLLGPPKFPFFGDLAHPENRVSFNIEDQIDVTTVEFEFLLRFKPDQGRPAAFSDKNGNRIKDSDEK